MPNSSDATTKPGNPGMTHAGPGLYGTFRCGQCRAYKSSLLGSGWKLVRGLRDRVCVDCKTPK